MIRFLTISALSLVILGACAKKKEEKPAEPAKPATAEAAAAADKAAVPAPTAAAILVIKAAKLTLEPEEDNPDGPESIVLEDSGNIIVAGETVATISADGKVVDKNGKEIASLGADGTLRFAGEEETALVGADGSLQVDGEKVASFDENNMLVMAEMDDKIKFEGPNEAKRAMMVVFMSAMMPGDMDDGFDDVDDSADAPMEE